MKTFQLLVILVAMFLAGCGSAGLIGSTVSAPGGPPAPPSGAPVGTSATASKSDGPVTPGSTVSNVQVNLQQGWNGVGFQSQLLTGLSGTGLISGQATFNGSGYVTGNFDVATLNAGAGPRRGFWVFAQAATSFTYSGVTDGSNHVDLTIPGYQMVSFCSDSDVPGSSITARQNGNVVPLGSVVLPQFFEIGAQGQPYVTVDVQNGGVLKPGKAYWVFANVASGVVRLTYNPLSPVASPSPGSSPGASPSPGSSPTPAPTPTPSPSPTPTPGGVSVATSLVFSNQPTAAQSAGASFSYGVQVLDQYGRLFTGSSVPVSLTIVSGPVGGGIDTTAISTAAGTATLPRSLNKAGLYVLRASSGSLVSANSNAITVNPTGPVSVGFIVQPAAGNINTPIPVRVALFDSFGNLANATTGGNVITLTGNGGTTAGATPTIAAGNSSQSTTFTVTAATTAMNLTATGTGLTSSTSTNFAVADGTGAALKLVFSAPAFPQTNVPIGTTIPVTVQIRDIATSTLQTSATNSITLSLAISGTTSQNATLNGSATSLTLAASSGVATFNVAPTLLTPLNLTASAAGFTPISASDTNGAIQLVAGPAASLRFAPQPPASAAAGSNLPSFTVEVLDALGNKKTNSTGSVQFTLGSGLAQLVNGTTALEPVTVAVAASGNATLTTGRIPVAQPGAVIRATYVGGDAISGGVPPANSNPIKVTNEPYRTGNLLAAAAVVTDPSLSDDGRWQVYTRGTPLQVYRRDRTTGVEVLVSAQDGTSAVAANDDCFGPQISDDGTRVVFTSEGTNLVGGFVGGANVRNVFLRRMDTNQTLLVSRGTASATAGGTFNSETAFISADGSRVGFETLAENLNGISALLGTTPPRQIVAASIAGAPSAVSTLTLASVNTTTPARASADCFLGGMSSDGLQLVYRSSSTNLNGSTANSIYRTALSGTAVSSVTLVPGGAAFAGSRPTIATNGLVAFLNTTPALTVANTTAGTSTVIGAPAGITGASIPVIDRTGGAVLVNYTTAGTSPASFTKVIRLSDNVTLNTSIVGALAAATNGNNRGVLTSGAAWIAFWNGNQITVEPGP